MATSRRTRCRPSENICDETKRKATRRRGESNRTLVRRLKDAIVNKVEKNEIKATVSDFVRLVELEKEMDEGLLRGIEVRWVDPSETDSAGER